MAIGRWKEKELLRSGKTTVQGFVEWEEF